MTPPWKYFNFHKCEGFQEKHQFYWLVDKIVRGLMHVHIFNSTAGYVYVCNCIIVYIIYRNLFIFVWNYTAFYTWIVLVEMFINWGEWGLLPMKITIKSHTFPIYNENTYWRNFILMPSYHSPPYILCQMIIRYGYILNFQLGT